MDKITICELEVFYRVGVTEEERAQPQRLLLTVEILHDFSKAAATDDLAETIDYHAVSQRLLHLGDDCHWDLIETVAVDIAQMIQEDFAVKTVSVEVKKFAIPQARHVAASALRTRAD